MVSREELAAIRERWQHTRSEHAIADRAALLAEVDRLTQENKDLTDLLSQADTEIRHLLERTEIRNPVLPRPSADEVAEMARMNERPLG